MHWPGPPDERRSQHVRLIDAGAERFDELLHVARFDDVELPDALELGAPLDGGDGRPDERVGE
jgi:hypothetical protein